MTLNPTQPPLTLTLEKPVYGGDCLARPDGKTIFVPLTLPGETVSAHITEHKRNFARAEADSILTPSPHRVPPPCPHFGTCGGCHLQHADYPTQLALKRQVLSETLTRAGVTLPGPIATLSAEPWAYRNRIRLAVAPSGTLGYRSRRSHDITPISTCPIAAPILWETAQLLAPHIATAPVPIAEVELFTNGTEVLLTLFTPADSENSQSLPHQIWLDQLLSTLPVVTSLRLQQDDAHLHPRILAHSGEPVFHYTAAGFPYRVEHGSFFQVNRFLLDTFVARVLASIPAAGPATLAWDLYAGVGLFARPLTQRFARVLAVEPAPTSFAALRENLAATTGTAIGSTTLDFLRRNRAEREPRPDFLVLDPPRAGLGDEVCTLLAAIHTPVMAYVSCDPATLARDLAHLTRERFHLASITLADMFPHTYHLETIAILTRR